MPGCYDCMATCSGDLCLCECHYNRGRPPVTGTTRVNETPRTAPTDPGRLKLTSLPIGGTFSALPPPSAALTLEELLAMAKRVHDELRDHPPVLRILVAADVYAGLEREARVDEASRRLGAVWGLLTGIPIFKCAWLNPGEWAPVYRVESTP